MIRLGMDLGTTYSAVAVVGADGRARVLENRVGELTTPSVVAFPVPGEAVVGSAAKDGRALDPENTVALIKRRMGTAFELDFHGVTHSPESISGLLLRAMADDARVALGVPADAAVEAVVTVPAYFGLAELEATRAAARLAGVTLLELVPEPVAAALHHTRRAQAGGTGDRTLLVYDLGGGTFDATILHRSGTNGALSVLATDGDPRLGGADVDVRLAALLHERFAEQHIDDPDALDDPAVFEQTATLAEIAKRNLSGRERTPVVLRHDGWTLRTEIDRQLLADGCRDLVDRTMTIVDRLMEAARQPRIDEIVLVGGSSRLPAVGDVLTDRFGLRPVLSDPELSVALGAALRAEQLASTDSVDRARAVRARVLPRAVGILLRDSHDPEGRREFVQHVIEANTPLPESRTTSFATVADRQRTLRIQVYEQAGGRVSDEVADNRRVLDGEFSGLAGLPAGSRVDVTLSVSGDGRIELTARDVVGRVDLTLEAYVDGVVDTAGADRLAATTGSLRIRR